MIGASVNRRAQTITALADAVVATAPRSRALVAVDGIGASGKTTLAHELVGAISARPVVVVHADDFFHPPEVRHARGRHSAEGFWLDTYDYPRLISEALQPSPAEGREADRAETSDRWSTPAATSRRTGQTDDDAVVLVEGAFLHRPELRSFWDFSIFIDVSFPVARRRMDLRAGTALGDELHARYADAQRIYFRTCQPWLRATVVLDNTDVHHPRVIEPDAAAARVG